MGLACSWDGETRISYRIQEGKSFRKCSLKDRRKHKEHKNWSYRGQVVMMGGRYKRKNVSLCCKIGHARFLLTFFPIHQSVFLPFDLYFLCSWSASWITHDEFEVFRALLHNLTSLSRGELKFLQVNMLFIFILLYIFVTFLQKTDGLIMSNRCRNMLPF
jgi:hypothetical protein